MLPASVEQWRGLVASIWPPAQVDNALAVMDCESRGNPNAHALTDREDSRGLLQINVYAHPGLGNLYDPETNLRAAYQIWQASGWGPWSCAARLGPGAPGNGDTGIGAAAVFVLGLVVVIGILT